MVRTPGYDKAGLKKGTWTPEEDRKLSAYVTKYGCWNWRQLPKYAGLARCGKSFRLRWMNYLRPNIKRGNYTKEEEDTIIRLHDKLGNRWSAIAAQLPGRTDNEIKNHWHTYLKKQKCMPTSTEAKPSDTTSNSVNDDLSQSCTESWNSSQVECEGEAVSQKSNEISSSPAATYLPTEMVEDFSETLDTFWSEPFFSEASMMVNEEFSGSMMYPAAGLLSPPHSTYFFDEELFYQYDNLFNSL